MSQTLAQLQAEAAAAAAESGIDMNEAQKGGGGRLLPAGYAFGRIVEYIEFGQQPQEFNGKAKDPALEFTLGFALWGQGYQNDDGTPYVVRTYNTALSRNEKARAFKMFKALNWKGTAKSYAQLIGEPILVKIIHKAKSKTDATIVSRIDEAGFLPPLDPVTRQPYAIPAAPDSLYRMFLWERPSKAAWDSLFIEGTFDDGKSKNRIQETILAALDFQGSPLQQLLMVSGVTTLPTAAQPAAALPASPVVATPQPAAVAAPVAVPQPAAAVAVPQVAAPLAVPAAVPATAAPTVPAPMAVQVPSPAGTTTSPSNPVLPAALPATPVLPV